jgi:hypothetical protein
MSSPPGSQDLVVSITTKPFVIPPGTQYLVIPPGTQYLVISTEAKRSGETPVFLSACLSTAAPILKRHRPTDPIHGFTFAGPTSSMMRHKSRIDKGPQLPPDRLLPIPLRHAQPARGKAVKPRAEGVAEDKRDRTVLLRYPSDTRSRSALASLPPSEGDPPMKPLALILAALTILPATLTPAQAPPPPPTVPTTHILAIGHLTAAATPETRAGIMPSEVRDTVRLYLAGKIDQWYVRQDTPGVVFLMNVTSTAEAHDLLEKLPLGKAHLMEFELIPLGPLSPLNILLK